MIEDIVLSGKSEDIVGRLYELGAMKGVELSSKVVEKLSRLVMHADPAVREAVALTAGIRLRIPSMYPIFLESLREFENSAQVLPPLIDAATVLVLHGSGDRDVLSKLLGGLVVNGEQPDEVRGVAYLALQRLWGRISQIDYAMAPRNLSEMMPDMPFIESVL